MNWSLFFTIISQILISLTVLLVVIAIGIATAKEMRKKD